MRQHALDTYTAVTSGHIQTRIAVAAVRAHGDARLGGHVQKLAVYTLVAQASTRALAAVRHGTAQLARTPIRRTAVVVAIAAVRAHGDARLSGHVQELAVCTLVALARLNRTCSAVRYVAGSCPKSVKAAIGCYGTLGTLVVYRKVVDPVPRPLLQAKVVISDLHTRNCEPVHVIFLHPRLAIGIFCACSTTPIRLRYYLRRGGYLRAGLVKARHRACGLFSHDP